MKYLILILLFLFPLGQLGRFSVFGSEVVLQINDAAVALAVLAGFYLQRKNIIKRVRNDQLTKPILLWVLAMIVSLIVNSTRLGARDLVISSFYAVRWISYAGLYFVFKSVSPEEMNITKLLLIGAATVVAILGIGQFIFLPDVSFLKAFNWDDHYYRVISTFLDPGFTGAVLLLGLILIFNYQLPIFNEFSSRKYLNLKNLLLTIVYSALALTYSRASYLMYLVSLGVVAWYRRSVKVLVIAALILGLTIVILPKSSGEGTKLSRENSVWARIHNWQQSIEIWQKEPVFGIGFDSYRYSIGATRQSHAGAGADSSVLLVLATTGIVGFLVFLNLLCKIWEVGRKDVIFAAGLAGILVHSWFNNTLFYPWVMEWLWILLATVRI